MNKLDAIIQPMNKFKENLQTVLDEKGWKASELAARLGVSRTTVSNWLKGEDHPNPRNLARAAKALSVPESRLVYGKNTEITEEAIQEALEGMDAMLERMGQSLPPDKRYRLAALFIKHRATRGELPSEEMVAGILYMAK